MHDVLDPRDLVPDEAEQLLSAGYPAADLLVQARAAAAAGDLAALAEVSDQLDSLAPSIEYDEPSDLETLDRLLPEHPPTAPAGNLQDRIKGAWLGRCVANTMGKPVEGLSRAEVYSYLSAAKAWPLSGFVPLLQPLPDDVSHLHESAAEASEGNFDAIPRDDDIDWTILSLFMLESHGTALRTDDIARHWLDRIPFTQTYTAERAAYRNLIEGLRPPRTATSRNPYREWIGALIRMDAYGYVNPGDPVAAARMALTDAVLSHTANGVYGATWAAALVAEALVVDKPADALRTALSVVPAASRLAVSQAALLDIFHQGGTAAEASDWIDTELGHYNWVHTLNNAAIISAALLWGEDDFVRTVGLAVGAGRDTDSTAATVGSVFGALHGSAAIPERLVRPSGGVIRSAVRGFDRITVDELAARTNAVRLALAEGNRS